MRCFNADYIFPVNSEPVKNGYVITDDEGAILSVTGQLPENGITQTETFSGFIVPGFINAHCHLELSYLKNQIPPCGGLTLFIKEILAIRNNYSLENIKQAVIDGDKEMYENGIVAVADISNDDYSFHQKSLSSIYYHTLLEAFDIVKERAQETFSKCIELGKKLVSTVPANSNFSIVPHAAYTVTPFLFDMIKKHSRQQHTIQSMHNQECKAESDLFINRNGDMFEFFTQMGDAMEQFNATGKNSLKSVLQMINRNSRTLLVHNTFTSKGDIEWAHSHHKILYWCFCPNANLYIENRLPDFENFISANANCCIGTDSYASNYSLSILDELKTIAENNSSIPLQTLLTWATINGAEYLGIEKTFGTIETGKKPGLNLISNVDLKNLQINPSSTVTRII